MGTTEDNVIRPFHFTGLQIPQSASPLTCLTTTQLVWRSSHVPLTGSPRALHEMIS
jgi:hypothetical protein